MGPPNAGVETFEDAIPAFLRKWAVPGASVVVQREGRLVFARGYGLADESREAPVRPDSLFRIGSISKPVTAVATLDLVDRGRLTSATQCSISSTDTCRRTDRRIDPLRFVRGVDRRSETEDVLDAETLDRMTARPDVPERDGGQQFYGMGWHVVSNEGTAPSLWHNGSLPGSYGFLLHSPRDDLTAAALFNGRSTDRKYRTFNVRSRQMMIDAVGNVSSWPQRDLFDRFA